MAIGLGGQSLLRDKKAYRGSQIAPRHVVPLRPFGTARVAFGTKAAFRSLRSPRLCVELRSHLAMKCLQKNRLLSEPYRGSQMAPRHVVPLRPFRDRPRCVRHESRYLFASLTAALRRTPFSSGYENFIRKDSLRNPFEHRGSQIRTDDILLPKQTLYQAELHPVAIQI